MEIFTDLLSSIATQATVDSGSRRRHRHRVCVLEHVGRRVAGVPADGARPRRELGRRRARSAIASTMNIAGHLVDVSPLSTIGALCIASVPAGDMSRKLFNQLLAWGMSMTVAGAVICYVLFA